ncbi:MAG: hypothetical protein IPM50_13190 [Acidobacteriota bacterium]|nr:MAG: hypothetical protein IPM50_13190 [Acidobacteriota bacterium]
MRFIFSTAVVLAIFAFAALEADAQTGEPGPIKSSPAYAEILLRKTELMSEIAAVAPDYTDTNPRILDLRNELAAIDRLLLRVFAVPPADTARLTQALGKLILKQAALEADLARLSRAYAAEHPEVKRAKRRLDAFDAAVKEILK